MRIDFHSHILPKLDDGAKNIEESIAILQKEKQDGVDVVVATPHYFIENGDIDCFLAKRETAYQLLLQASSGLQLPSVILGAEVYFTPSIARAEDIGKLCIGNTKYIMLEMPYQKFSRALYENISNLIITHDVHPILAHIERYADFMSFEQLCTVASLNVLGQINCSSLLDSRKKTAMRCIENGMVHLLGTDAHSMSDRPPRFNEACAVIKKKYSDEVLSKMLNNAEKILQNADIDEIDRL